MRRTNLYFDDILDSIEVIKKRVEDVSEEEFKLNAEKHESVVYRLASIGEAVNKIPKSKFENYPDIPWAGIISMRNVIVHEYYEVDLDIVWDTIVNDLDVLEEAILSMKKGD